MTHFNFPLSPMSNPQTKFNLKTYLRQAFIKGTTINDYNLRALVLIGTFGHPIFALFHIYLFEMPWESMKLKISAGFVCLLLSTKKFWPEKMKGAFPYYWHFMLIYNLPFLITLTSLNNEFIKTWLMWDIIMLYILIMFVPQWFIFVVDLAIGVGAAFIYHTFFTTPVISDPTLYVFGSNPLDPMLYGATFLFAIISGLVFSYSNASGVAFGERAKIFKSLAGSIAHELRNPLNSINLAGAQINELAAELDQSDGKTTLGIAKAKNIKSHLLELTSHISDSIGNANNIINIILNDLSEKRVDASDFAYLEPAKILPKIIDGFGYRNDEERQKVKFILPSDEASNFLFRAVPERFSYIIFNLLKNALYYLDQYPNSVVSVGSEVREVNGIEYNVIYVNDTGPGIPDHVIPKLFGDFYTSGKKDGTGLGLSFCKRNMQVFGGDIICESELGRWTRFSLLFPKLSDAQVKMAAIESGKKKILLVDDQEVNLLTTKAKIEKILPHISCDLARSGKEAIAMTKRKKYELILMDIKMPDMSGDEAAKKIRIYDKDIPIVALTWLDRDLVLDGSSENLQKEFSDYLSKSSKDNLLYRGVTKWILDANDEMSYVGTKEGYAKELQGKKVLLADDQKLNRIMTKKSFESVGLVVSEVDDGLQLLELYQGSLDANGKSSFDVIVTDINMISCNGDDATKKIREIEAANNVRSSDEIPIIALSGDGEREDIHHFFECRMTDYFVKGSKPEMLLKIIANYLKDRRSQGDSTALLEEGKVAKKPIIFNSEVLDNYFGPSEKTKILEMSLSRLDDLMKQIFESKKSNDEASLLFFIHSVKGDAANIGAEILFENATALETKIKNKNAEEDWFATLEKIYADLRKEVLALIS